MDDLAFQANTPAQAEFLLHSLEQAARGIGLYVEANKTNKTLNKNEPSSTEVKSLWN